MTVSSTSSRTVLAGDGSNTAWPFAFKVQQPADLVVTWTDATGNDIVLTSSQYDATGFGQDAGGTVTYPTAASGSPAIAAGTTLTLQRVVAPVQPTQVSNQGAMWPAVLEGALDRLTMIVQGFIDGMNRGLRVAATDGTALNVLPAAAARANSALLFDADGQPYAGAQVAGTAGFAAWLLSNVAAQATSAAAAQAALGLGSGATIAATGSYSLPGGLIAKWGTSGAIAGAGNATIGFAAPFPGALFGALLTPGAASTGYTDTGSASGFRIHNNGSNSATFFWVAFGN